MNSSSNSAHSSADQIFDGAPQPDVILDKEAGPTAEGSFPPTASGPSAAAYFELQALLKEEDDPHGPFHYASCSWETVVGSMDQARADYEAKGAKSKLRKLSRNDPLIATLGYLTKMIPEENGIRVLCGGLTMIFKLAQKRIQSQERILRTFNEIPFIFENAALASMRFHDDNELRNRVMDLYTRLIEELPKLVKVLLREHGGKIHQRLFKQHPDAEAGVIDLSLDIITNATRAVNVWVQGLRDRLSMDTHQLSMETHQSTTANTKSLEKLHEMQATMIDMMSELKAAKTQATVDASRYLQSFSSVELFELERAIHEKCSIVRSTITIPSAPMEATQDLRPTASWQSEFLGHPTSATTSRQVLTDAYRMDTSGSFESAYHHRDHYEMTAADMALADGLHALIELLSFPRYFHFSDLERVLRQGTNIEDNFLQRGKWLLDMERFNAWLYSEGVDMLLVEGYCEENFGKVSSLSVSCAILVTRLIEEGSMVLYHFCGEHTSPGDPMFGPVGILRSFVLQLAAYGCPINAVFGRPFDESLLQELREQTLYASAFLFVELLQCILRDCQVYIVIDNISEFESKLCGWDEETREIVELIQMLSAANNSGPKLKTLMTCSITSLVVREMLAPEDQIGLRADNHFA